MKTRLFFWRLMTRKLEPAVESQHKRPNWGLAFPQCSSPRRGSERRRGQWHAQPLPQEGAIPLGPWWGTGGICHIVVSELI